MTRPDWPDDIETVAQRVLDGKGTPEDSETIALWALQVAKFIRRDAEAPQ
jgi:hypothetical protein